ncbi:hypothetical protein JW835_14745 [bacterium]|nr:hypothetical protein [bacterium]
MIGIIRKKITQEELYQYCEAHFKTFVKFVADIEKEILAAGGELHADTEKELLESGSKQSNLWGGNFYPWKHPNERLEYTSFINIRSRDNNTSMEVMDSEIRRKMQILAANLLLNEDETMHMPEPG